MSSWAAPPWLCLPTLAPHVASWRVGPSELRRRPLAGWRLSRQTVLAGLPLGWPWSLSLPASRRLGPAFAGLPVLCDHPTPLVSSSSRPFVLDEFRSRCLAAGAERPPRVRTQNFTPTPSPLRGPPDGYWASLLPASSPSGTHALRRFIRIRFGAAPLDFHRTPPRGPVELTPNRDPVLRASALVSLVGGSLRQGPQRTYAYLMASPRCSVPMPGAQGMGTLPGFP